jgi:hypothetical protein
VRAWSSFVIDPESIDVIEAQVPAELDVHLILDNYGTHKTALIGNGSPNVHAFTCTSPPPTGSWINLVVRWFAEFTNNRVRRGMFGSVKTWKRQSANTSTCTTNIPGPSFGPKQQTKSWPASLVTRSANLVTYDTN